MLLLAVTAGNMVCTGTKLQGPKREFLICFSMKIIGVICHGWGSKYISFGSGSEHFHTKKHHQCGKMCIDRNTVTCLIIFLHRFKTFSTQRKF